MDLLRKKNENLGFTFIELMVVLAIFSIIAGIVLQQGASLSTAVELENAANNIDLKIRTAKTRSIGALNDKNYGVHFEPSRIVIFDGTSAYVDGAAGNEVFNLPQNVEINSITLYGGGSNIIFDRLTGNTSSYGNIGLRSKRDMSETKTIFINSNGQNSFSSFDSSVAPAITNARHTHFDLGWNIKNSTKLILRWYSASDVLILEKQIDTAAYFNADKSKFNWTATINESGINQKITVNSWEEAPTNDTILDVIRHNTEGNNNKLKIYFNDAGEKHIATYTNAAGAVSVAAEAYGGVMYPQ